jgi:hypothetical protein
LWARTLPGTSCLNELQFPSEYCNSGPWCRLPTGKTRGLDPLRATSGVRKSHNPAWTPAKTGAYIPQPVAAPSSSRWLPGPSAETSISPDIPGSLNALQANRILAQGGECIYVHVRPKAEHLSRSNCTSGDHSSYCATTQSSQADSDSKSEMSTRLPNLDHAPAQHRENLEALLGSYSDVFPPKTSRPPLLQLPDEVIPIPPGLKPPWGRLHRLSPLEKDPVQAIQAPLELTGGTIPLIPLIPTMSLQCC